MKKFTADFETAVWLEDETWVWAWATCEIGNEENLKEQGWEQILDFMPVPDENCFWTKRVPGYKLELCSFSNTPDKSWNIHIDNDRGESLASMDVQTFSEVNKLLRLIEN